METIQRQQITISIPVVEMDIFKTIANKFSWKISSSEAPDKCKKTAFQKSQEDIKAGRINTYKNSNELFEKLGCI